LKLQDEPHEGLMMGLTTEGLDLAISEKETADDTSRLILDKVKFGNGEIKPGDFIIRQVKVGKMSPNEVRELVKWDYENIKPDGIRVESVGYQEAMVRDLNDVMGIPVHGYHTGGEKKDPDIGVNSLAILLELGKLVIPYSNKDPRTTQIMSRLLNEMRAWPDGHTGDILMSLWFAYSEARDLTGNRLVIPSMIPLVKDPVNVKNPEVRKIEEPKVELAMAAEQEAQRRFFAEQMGGLWHR
jgi:hypothetical protein